MNGPALDGMRAGRDRRRNRPDVFAGFYKFFDFRLTFLSTML